MAPSKTLVSTMNMEKKKETQEEAGAGVYIFPDENPQQSFFSTSNPSAKTSYIPLVQKQDHFAQALKKLLKTPIAFVPATSLTFEDEAKMAPTLRSRRGNLIDPRAQETHDFPVSMLRFRTLLDTNTVSAGPSHF